MPKFLTENTKRIVSVPKCMSHNVLCNQYADLLLKLGQLAFHTFFQDIKETSLVIESTTVLKFLSNQELEFCLKIGLLSQTKDKSLIAVKRYKVFFQHKSVQDFLAALYVTSEWKNGTIKTTIIQVCSSLSGILEMENIFVFVCGMNSDVYKCISGELQKTVDLDSVTIRYRTYMYIDAYDRVSNDDKRMMMSYQSMQLQCFQESERNGNESCSVPLCDILLDDNRLTDDDLTALKTIIHINKGNVKSLQSFKRKNIFMKSLDPGVFTSLETLRLYESFDEPEWLADILTESALTLKCLTLSGYESISLSDISITALTGLKCLQSLCLRHITITHSNLERLYTYINHITTLTRIQMEWIDCSNHKKKHNDCEITVDLLLLKELERVELVMVKMSPESWSKLFLSVGQLHVPRSITVKLTWILMTSKEWRDLLLSVGRLPQSVTVELKWCKGPSEDVWKSIVEEIRSTPKLSLLPEISIDMWGEASLTLKNH